MSKREGAGDEISTSGSSNMVFYPDRRPAVQFASNLVWNAWRTAAADKPFAADENNQVILQTLPVVVPGLFGTDTPTPSVLQINPQIVAPLNQPTATRTPTPINIGNFVWDDIDSDGRQDAGEPGLPGITVQLWNGAKTQLIASGSTNSNGNYTLIAPLPGQYRIRVLLPLNGDQFSPKDQAGGDDTDDSDINPAGTNFGFTDVIDIASNVISITSIDAGIIKFRLPLPPHPNTYQSSATSSGTIWIRMVVRMGASRAYRALRCSCGTPPRPS
ncbi:MAG: SdrD B-like domain-containing protein [Anaerolineae bacterium]